MRRRVSPAPCSRPGWSTSSLLYLAPTLLGRGARPLADLEAPASMAERLEFAIVGREDVGGDLLLRLRPRRGQG